MAVRSQKTTMMDRDSVKAEWKHIDAADQVLGRLATRVATILMGKHKPTYTPHVDTGDFVVVTNCQDLRVTGAKLDQTTYDRYSGYPGGLHRTQRRKIYEDKPEHLLRLAVKRMLPKTPLGRHMLKKLKAYPAAEHPHQAQNPQTVEL